MTHSLPADAPAAVPRWLAWWLLAMVALWPLPGVAGAVLALGALVLALQLGLRRLRQRPALLGRPLALLTGVLFLAYWLPQLLSAPAALDAARAWKEVAGDLRFLPLLWAVALAVSERAGRERVFLGLAVIAAAWTADALVQAVTGLSPWFGTLEALKALVSDAPLCRLDEAGAGAGRLSGALGPCDPKLGLVLASLSPFLLWAVARRWGGIGWALAATAVGVVILLAGARAAWLTYALVLACSGWRHLGARRVLLLALLGLAVATAVALVSPQVQQRLAWSAQALSGDAGGVDAALSGRSRIWQAAWCMVEEAPLTGVGVRGFRVAWPHCDPLPAQAPAWGGGDALHAHQWVLEVLSETGALGLLLWIAGGCFAARAWCRASPRQREAAHPAMLALALTLFPFNTHLAVYSTFWGGVVMVLAGLYAGSLQDRPVDGGGTR